MKARVLITLLLAGKTMMAQTGPDNFLQAVEQNNKELQAASDLLEARDLSSRTGLNPSDPVVAYGYYPGRPSEIGLKQTWEVSQSLEFPAVYFTRKKLSDTEAEGNQLNFGLKRMDILLRAKLVFIDYVYYTRKQEEYAKRVADFDQLFRSYTLKFNQGDASVLELNKARIMYLTLKGQFEMIIKEKEALSREMTMLNGGIPFVIDSAVYGHEPLMSLDSLLQESARSHPLIVQAENAVALSRLNTQLARQSWLPELQIGYMAEIVNEETFRGFRAGMSIPLWQDRNKERTARAELDYRLTQAQSEKLEVETALEKMYQAVQSGTRLLEEYRNSIDQARDLAYIRKALDLGQISVIDYILEISFYYNITDLFMETEKQVQRDLAALYAFRL